MTSPAATLTDLEATAFNETSNIHYSRPATIFAAVAASIFTFVGITGKENFWFICVVNCTGHFLSEALKYYDDRFFVELRVTSSVTELVNKKLQI